MVLSFALEVSPSDPMNERVPYQMVTSLAKGLVAVSVILMSGSAAVACNIPVFRYALERWQPDNCELILFHEGPLTANQQKMLNQLKDQQTARSKDTSSSLTLSDLTSPTPVHGNLWNSIRTTSNRQITEPYLVVRMKLGKGQIVNGWHGPLSDAVEVGIVDSPARRELAKRLLSGHSVVWVVVRADMKTNPLPASQGFNAKADTALKSSFSWLSNNLELPEGIGLPGSELHSEIPLLLKFSTLEISREDVRESFLINLFSELQPEATRRGEDLIVPVFGRGRALEVIPASVLTSPLIKDLAVFLSGACSCQVKEQNPGFDLLMSVDWNTKLFGKGSAPPPVRSDRDRFKQKPELLTIPSGN
jgi:hypothetical protein